MLSKPGNRGKSSKKKSGREEISDAPKSISFAIEKVERRLITTAHADGRDEYLDFGLAKHGRGTYKSLYGYDDL